MAKYLVETYYTCSFKVSHYLDDVNEKNLQNLEKNEDGKFEILDVKLDNRKTKNLEKIDTNKVNIIDKSINTPIPQNASNIDNKTIAKVYLNIFIIYNFFHHLLLQHYAPCSHKNQLL